jgi:CRISPR/Cas system endoribonuclease Cas6 (RAMP superfamily)
VTVQSILLSVAGAEDDWWRRPAAVRSFAYALFGLADPGLALTLHGMEGQRPFTIGVLEEKRGFYIRVTALDEETRATLLRATARLSEGATLTFGEGVVTAPGYSLDAPPLAGRATYGELARARFQTHASLEFVTPTAFSQGGDLGLHLPLPVPELMLRSWGRRWNQFAPAALEIPEEMLAGLTARVGLAEARVETTTACLLPGKLVGFTGAVTLEALGPRRWSEGERAAFAALAAYSRYCGTGVRTTQGFGLTLPDEMG